MNKWFWIDSENGKTNTLELSNSLKYHISKIRFGKSFRIDLYEEDNIVASENTFNNTFIDAVNEEQDEEEQIIEWATRLTKRFIQECDKCSEIKFCKDLTDGTKQRSEFKGYGTLCTSCRKEIWEIINEKSRAEREEEHKQKMNELSKDPPQIIGNFKKRI